MVGGSRVAGGDGETWAKARHRMLQSLKCGRDDGHEVGGGEVEEDEK